MASEKGKAFESGMTCEKCGKPMVYRWSRHGKFLGCSGYPECKNTMRLDENGEVEETEPTDEVCELCGSPMIVKTGRRGKFLGCSNYPECRFTKSIGANEIEIPEELKKCDKCGAEMVVKFGRRGPFIACSAYPDCKNTKPIPKEGKGRKSAGKTDGGGRSSSAKRAGKSTRREKKSAEGPAKAPIEVSDEKCEQCGAVLVVKNGRFGPFLACPNYPKCKFTKKLPK